MKNRTHVLAVIVLTSAFALASEVHACGFDGLMDGNFKALNPTSIKVAVAIRKAITSGELDASAAAPITPGAVGYWRAVKHIEAFKSLIVSGHPSPIGPISVLLIDSDLWSRISPGPNGLVVDVHTVGPRDGDVVIVTSEPIIAAVLEGRTELQWALKHEVIAIDGPSDDAKAVLATVERSSPSQTLKAHAADRTIPVFFGPTR
jgi:hypothetical protein